jgi:hypothetical protein
MTCQKLILVIILNCIWAVQNYTQAQDSVSGTLIPKLELIGFWGKSLPHHEEMKQLCKNPFYGAEIRFGYQTTGLEYWHKAYKFPFFGLGYYCADFNQKAIGTPMALFSFIELPFYRGKNFSLSTSWSAGVAFHINEYDSIKNPENLAIGSDLNAYIDFSVLYKQRISQRLDLGIGLKLQHFSNGATKYPNWGMNMVGAQVVLSYMPRSAIRNFHILQEPEYNKDFEFYLMYAGGLVGKKDRGSDHYYNSTLSMSVTKRVSFKRTVGLGIDVFYNEYLKSNFPEEDDIQLNKLVSQSVFLTTEMIINKFRMAVCLGFYTLRYDDYTKPYYERVALRYYFIPNMFANVSIKAHAAKAEYIEWGLGVSF